METRAICLKGPEDLIIDRLPLKAPVAGDIVVEISHSGISTGTEKLFWSGQMPPFPGMGYPLVPGYEAAGEVVEADPATGYRAGDHVFVPGADCCASTQVMDPRARFWRWPPPRGTPWRASTRPCPILSSVTAFSVGFSRVWRLRRARPRQSCGRSNPVAAAGPRAMR
jgi:NADPH:quinone reductase-like Zn-dependent oxidoreductase